MNIYRSAATSRIHVSVALLVTLCASMLFLIIGCYFGRFSRDGEVNLWREAYTNVRPEWFTASKQFVNSYAARGSFRPTIVSFDGGKNWYAGWKEGNGGIRLVGPAEEKYPGILAELRRYKTQRTAEEHLIGKKHPTL